MYCVYSDVFGPTIKSENIPGTPMESMDALLISESIEISSTTDSSIANDSSTNANAVQSQELQDEKRLTVENHRRNSDANLHSNSNSNATNNLINNERYWQRPSITSTDEAPNKKKRNSKQEV